MLDKDAIWPGLWERRDAGPALVWMDEGVEEICWTFADLFEATASARAFLQAQGLRRGDQLLLISDDCPQVFALLHASLQLGLELLPLHPDQERSILDCAQSRRNHALTLVERALPDSVRACLRGRVLDFDKRAKHWLPQQDAGVASGAEAGSGAGAGAVAVVESAAHEPGGALVFHSSGSSGKPKAIRYDAADLATFLYWQQRLFAAFPDLGLDGNSQPSPRVNTLPTAHWGGLSFCLQAHMEGRCLYLFSRFEARSLLATVARSGCQLLMLVPAMYRDLLPVLQEQGPPQCLRYCLNMGESLPILLAMALRSPSGPLLLTAYGMTEALTGLAHGSVPLHSVPPGSCGRHSFGALRLVAEDGEVAPENGPAEGELWVRNETVRPRYLDASQCEAKYVDGWYRSGDWMRRDAQGNYYFCSRMDDMCVHNGRNVEPWQVEDIFLDHPQVADCVACPLKTRDGRKRMALLVASESRPAPTQAQLLDYHVRNGAIYAAPGFIHVCEALPRLASGKADRRAIRRILQEAYNATWVLQ